MAAVRRAGVTFRLHEYVHRTGTRSYGDEAAAALEAALGIPAGRVFKTLVVTCDGRLAVGVLPVDRTLDLGAMAAALGSKRAVMADVRDAERSTGYPVGGISPLGQRRRLPLVVDGSAMGWDTIFVSAGRRGLEIELRPADLLALTAGRTAAVAR